MGGDPDSLFVHVRAESALLMAACVEPTHNNGSLWWGFGGCLPGGMLCGQFAVENRLFWYSSICYIIPLCKNSNLHLCINATVAVATLEFCSVLINTLSWVCEQRIRIWGRESDGSVLGISHWTVKPRFWSWQIPTIQKLNMTQKRHIWQKCDTWTKNKRKKGLKTKENKSRSGEAVRGKCGEAKGP